MNNKLVIGDVEIGLDVSSPSFAEHLAKDEAIALELAIFVQEKLENIIKRESAGLDGELVKSFERAFLKAWAREEADVIEAQLERIAKDLREESEPSKPAL